MQAICINLCTFSKLPVPISFAEKVCEAEAAYVQIRLLITNSAEACNTMTGDISSPSDWSTVDDIVAVWEPVAEVCMQPNWFTAVLLALL